MKTPYIVVSDYIEPKSVFTVVIPTASNEVTFYVTADRADHEAKKLSLVMPGVRISITKMARVKAAYKDGERLCVNDYRDFYAGLTDEEYQATLIQDSRTAEMI